MPPILVPKLKSFLTELDEIAPLRTKPDWWIGNEQHQGYPSGHNPDETGLPELRDPDFIDEVRAVDIRLPLNRQGLSLWNVFDYLRKECKTGRITWIYYLIHNRKITSARSNWEWRDYGGYSPHTEHGHISGNLESDKPGYKKVGLANLVEDIVTPADIEKIADAVIARLDKAPIRQTDENGVNQGLNRSLGGTLDALAHLAHAINSATAVLVARPTVVISEEAINEIAAKISTDIASDTVDEFRNRLTEGSSNENQ